MPFDQTRLEIKSPHVICVSHVLISLFVHLHTSSTFRISLYISLSLALSTGVDRARCHLVFRSRRRDWDRVQPDALRLPWR